MEITPAYRQKMRNALAWLAKPALVFYLMPALMALLVVGTVAQAQIGLYEAHRTYFSSFAFLAFSFIPLPGGYTLLMVLTVALLVKFLGYSDWSWRKSGIILTHLGALLLLLGGLFTALSAREGYMVIAEGDQSPYVYDYHAREMLVFKNDQLEYRISAGQLESALNYGKTALPLGLNIVSFCENCAISKREETEQDFVQNHALQSMAQFMALQSKPKEKEAEANLSGVSFILGGLDDPAQDGLYIAFEAMPKPIEVQKDGAAYKIIYGKSQRLLPFAIKLIDFKKDDYPGMQMARAYSSDVLVLDGGAEWTARIEMNAPLRYKGYTFYQSSFDQSGEAEMSVLSVVENKGRLFPYIGTLVIMIGLLVHIVLIFRQRVRT